MPHEPFSRIALGVITGVAFGFFLNKGSAASSDTIPEQLSGKNSSVLKIMLTASAVGALGTQILKAAGHAEAKVKPLNSGGILGGGVLFGTGMAVSGYCPGTSMAALGTGKKDAALTVLGMLSGATAFVRAYPTVKPLIEMGSFGKRTLPELTRTSPWVWIAAMFAATGIIRFYERKRTYKKIDLTCR